MSQTRSGEVMPVTLGRAAPAREARVAWAATGAACDSDGRVTPELRQLRSFVAVAEAGSLTRAAAGLHIAQQSLSQQMRTLEAPARRDAVRAQRPRRRR